MKVYEFYYNADKYQSFMHNCSDDDLRTVFSFNATSKAEVWKQPEGLYIANPMKEKGDFFHLGRQVAMNEKALTILKLVTDGCCELLPFKYENQTYYVMNIINAIDCYDYKKGKYEYRNNIDNKDNIIGIKKYAFNPANFNEKSLFKDDIFKIENFTYEGFLSDPEKEFKYLYEKHNLKGLTFRLFWDSEKDC